MDQSSELVESLARHIREILHILGENPDRNGLSKTPERAAKALLYLTQGYNMTDQDAVGEAFFECDTQDMVIVRNIEYYSLCEHHILPFFGHVSIGYLPSNGIIGLSKIARIVNLYARRLQVQERMTREICNAISEIIPNRGVIVYCTADHLCMKMRGVEKNDSSTVTFAQTGEFLNSVDLRNQFFNSLNIKS